MAVGSFIAYNSFIYRAMRDAVLGESNLNGTYQALLLDNAYVPSLAHATLADVVANECTDPDYGRRNIAGLAVSQDGSSRTVIDANDVDFGNAVTIGARYIVIVCYTGVNATSYLVGYMDLNDGGAANVQSTNDDFDVGWNAAGIYRITPNV